jgi:hypothetical protein
MARRIGLWEESPMAGHLVDIPKFSAGSTTSRLVSMRS